MHRIKEFYEQLYSSETPGESIIEETSEEIPDIMTSEVINAIKEMKRKKASGPDKLDIDVIKEAGEPLAKELTKLYSHCLKHRKVPNAWKNSELILVHKEI